MEDDLDALESVGSSTDWMTGAALTPGSIHDRVTHVAGVGLPPAGASWHDPNAATPIFFSVTRNSPGRGGSAVRSNFVLDGGAGADIFVAAKIPGDPPGVGTNLLFIDQAELGLLPTDDLDGLILWVCPEYRYYVQGVIGAVAANLAGAPMPADSARIGVGMTISITKYLAGSIPPDCIRVGFSVTTDAVGMEYTAVDYEAGPVPGPGPSSAAGDIFYATVDGTPTNPNYLWYQATDLGLDGGAWMNGASTNLLDLSDNLNGLDSDSRTVSGVPRGNVIGIEPELADAVPNPFGAQTRIGFTLPHQGHLRLTVTDLSGRRVATLADGNSGPGRGAVMWGGRADDGKRLTPGVYFVRMDFDGRALNRKLVLVR
jgi:hypothetical protein